MLGVKRLLAGAKSGGDSVLEHLAVEQGLSELADRLLAARAQALLVVGIRVDAAISRLIDISLTGASGSTEILLPAGMRKTLIKGLLGAAAARCTPLLEPVAWAGLLRREKAGMSCMCPSYVSGSGCAVIAVI